MTLDRGDIGEAGHDAGESRASNGRDGLGDSRGRALGFVLGLAFTALFCSCSDQPKPFCTSARVPYAARYTLVSGSGACAEMTGEVLGVYTFNGSHADQTPNWADATMSIQPSWMVGQPTNEPDDSVLSLGHFDGPNPGPNGLCTVATLSPAALHVPAVTEASADEMGSVVCPTPARYVRYEWRDVAVVVSPAVVGTAFSADLTYAVDECVAHYRVWAVSPVVACAAPPTMALESMGDADASADQGQDVDAASSEPQEADAAMVAPCTTPQPQTAPATEPSLCLAPNPATGRFVGSAMNPDFVVACDPVTSLCLPTQDPTAGDYR